MKFSESYASRGGTDAFGGVRGERTFSDSVFNKAIVWVTDADLGGVHEAAETDRIFEGVDKLFCCWSCAFAGG